MSKIRLPKAVCETLDRMLQNYPEPSIISKIYDRDAYAIGTLLSEQNYKTIMEAFVLGYEPELTPEDRIKELCSSVYNDPNSYFDKGFKFGAQRALELHGISYDWMKS